MKLRIPYVTVANALYIDFSGYTPAGIFGWPHKTTPDALARNLQAVTAAVRFCYNEGTKSYAKELGFKSCSYDSGSFEPPFLLVSFSYTVKGPIPQLYFVVVLPNGNVVEPRVEKRIAKRCAGICA
jgi:hypothetical protein